MQIQVEELYLFETEVNDPFFLGEKDGITTQFSNPRTLNFLNIVTVFFFFANIAKTGLTYSIEYGGEDKEIQESYGKSSSEYTIEFNVPTFRQRQLEELIGKEFSILGRRRDLSVFVIFGRFTCNNLDIDNEVQQRISFTSSSPNARIYTVNSFNIENIENVVDGDDFDSNGFDYGLDFTLN